MLTDFFPYIAFSWAVSFVFFSFGAIFWLFKYWRDALVREFFRERVSANESTVPVNLKKDLQTLVWQGFDEKPQKEVMSALSNVVATYAVNKEDVIPIIHTESSLVPQDLVRRSVSNIFISFSAETPEGQEMLRRFARSYLLRSHWRLDNAPFLGALLARMIFRATRLYSEEVIQLIASRARVRLNELENNH